MLQVALRMAYSRQMSRLLGQALLLRVLTLALAMQDIASLRASCRKQLWLTGMQLKSGTFGGMASYEYLDHMLVGACWHTDSCLQCQQSSGSKQQSSNIFQQVGNYNHWQWTGDISCKSPSRSALASAVEIILDKDRHPTHGARIDLESETPQGASKGSLQCQDAHLMSLS